MTRAYSYLRFSTPEQMQGDSFRRQSALAQTYAQKHGLDLDTSLNFHDLGMSAYYGKNLGAEGQLGNFIQAVKSGLVPQGSYLLVESLDRISRQNARTALRSLESVVDAGAVVVTLIDGRKYDQESLNNDPMSLLLSILTFMRSHEESATKASRLKAAWSEKRGNAIKSGKPMTASCPAWLSLDKGTGTFSVIPERAAIVQRIFRMTLEGVGQHGIAQAFNREGVQTFGRSLHWHSTYISKILGNPAVSGIFIPHVQERSAAKLVRHARDPISDYFPTILDSETVGQVKAMNDGTVQPRRGRHAAAPLSNLFGGLGRCSKCGSTVTLTNKGNGNRYLVCTRAKAGAGCTYKAIRYQQVQDCFRSVLPELLDTAPDVSQEEAQINFSLQTLSEQKKWLDETIQSILLAIEGRESTPATVVDRLTGLELERTKLLEMEQETLLRKQSLARNVLEDRFENLRTLALSEPMDKTRVNAVLRQLFSAIHIDGQAEVIAFQWQHSKRRTPIRYAESVEGRVLSPVEPPQMPPVPALPTVFTTL